MQPCKLRAVLLRKDGMDITF